jgi:TPR repeat protein
MSTILLAALAILPTSASAGMSPEEVKAFEGFKRLAEKGDPQGQYNLGDCYYSGEGVARNQVEAVKWYRKAADQGLTPAQFRLFVCYFNGYGVPKDQVEGAKWCRMAADQGNLDAQFALGYLYYYGTGVPKDDIEAYAYYNLAATELPLAQAERDRLQKDLPNDVVLRGQQRSRDLFKDINDRKAVKTGRK